MTKDEPAYTCPKCRRGYNHQRVEKHGNMTIVTCICGYVRYKTVRGPDKLAPRISVKDLGEEPEAERLERAKRRQTQRAGHAGGMARRKPSDDAELQEKRCKGGCKRIMFLPPNRLNLRYCDDCIKRVNPSNRRTFTVRMAE